MFLPRLTILFLTVGRTWGQQFERHHQVFVQQGELQGVLYKFDDDHRVQMFYGVPYAQPPIGKLRFNKPEPIKQWHGKKHADIDYGSPCIQFLDFHIHDQFSRKSMKKQSEDCLYLNIFAPYHDDKGRRHPVLVWVHGGSYLAGSGDTGMDKSAIIKNLIFKDVVLVTINYRLGPLGFLSYEDENGNRKGNFGLWDQVMALKWIHQNIRHFNGDADSVTIIGESAGASSVSALAVSPVTEGLIHRAIIMSGSVAANWAVFRSNETKSNWDAQNIIKYLNCEKVFGEDLVKEVLEEHELEKYGACNLLEHKVSCLVTNSISALTCLRDNVNFSDPIFNKILSTENGVSKLIIDGELVTDQPELMLKNNSRIPIMIGIAEDEWGHKEAVDYSFTTYEPVTENVAAAKINAAVKNFGLTLSKLPNTTLDLIANVTYYNYMESRGKEPPFEQQAFVQIMRQIEADIDFVTPMYKEVEAYAANSQPVFVYVFEYVPDSEIVEDETKEYDFFGQKRTVRFNRTVVHDKTFHGLDHGYLFSKGYSGNYQVKEYGKRDQKMANLFSTLVTNFATHGDPTPKRVRNLKWSSYEQKRPRYLHLKMPPKMESNVVGPEAVKFWGGLAQFLSTYAAIDDVTAARKSPLIDEERLELQAYKRAWWALWVLVAAIALVLWIVVICMVAHKCCRGDQTGPKPNPHFIVASSQI